MADDLTEAIKKAVLGSLNAENRDPEKWDEIRFQRSLHQSTLMPTVKMPKLDADGNPVPEPEPPASGEKAKRIIERHKGEDGK